METRQCLNCSAPLSGNYCSNCGEKVYHAHDKSVAHLFEEVAHFLTHFEGKLFKSLRAMFTRPGLMSYDYCRGLRKKYFKPVSLYILVVVVYLLFPLFQGLNMPLENYSGQGFGAYAQSTIAKKQEHKGISYDALKAKFEAKSGKVSKFMLILVLPLCALPLMLLFRRKDLYFFDHFILSAEINSFFLIIQFFLVPFVFMLLGLLFHLMGEQLDGLELLVLRIVLGIMIIYAVQAFRRFYQSPWPMAILKSIAFCGLQFYIVFVLYKFLLFTTVMALI